MANRGRHVVHIPEDYSDKDMSRPRFDRAPGQMGIYVEINDAEPIDPHAYGTHLYFLRETVSKLDQELRKVAIDVVKGVFERKNFLLDCIFEDYHDENIIAVSFESPEGPENIWQLHERGHLAPILQDLYVTDILLKELGARSLKLEVRLWEDEYDACKSEISQGKVKLVPLKDSVHDKTMIRKIKSNHSSLAERLMVLKDALTIFDRSLGEFIMILKQNLPKGTEKICSYNEFIGYVDKIKELKRTDINTSVLDEYTRVIQAIKVAILEVEDKVVHPLLEVHHSSETPFQRELKSRMRNSLKETKSQIEPSFDFYKLNHKEWQSKILLREQKLFLGLISVLPKSVDTIIDIDSWTDEYISGLQIKIKI